MKKKHSIGLTVHNFENDETLLLLKHLIENNIKIDYIIYHQPYIKRKILNIINFFLRRNSSTKEELLNKIDKIDTFNIPDINSEQANNVFLRYEPSLVLCNTGIIKQNTIKKNSNTYLINTHVSKLPRYRGVSNVLWALWDGEDIFVTIHRINNGIDEGDILHQELLLKNTGNMLSENKLDNLNNLTAMATCKAILKFNNCENTFIKQTDIGNPLMQFYSMHPILQDILKNKQYNR